MRLLTLFVYIFLAGALLSCSTVKIHDDPWCADAGSRGAKCSTALSGRRFSLNKYQWDKLRAGQICTATKNPGEGYRNVKVPLEKLCADTNLCTAQQKEKLEKISQEIEDTLEGTEGSPVFSGDEPANSAGPTLGGLGLKPEE